MKKRLLSFLTLLTIVLTLNILSASAEEDEEEYIDILGFGHYEQDNDIGNGVEPIEWIILDEDQDKFLLTTNDALDCIPYNEDGSETTWAESSIREWLNNEFYNAAFTDEEKQVIITSHVSCHNEEGSPEWTTDNGNSTTDKVFLLSVNEVQTYFEDYTTVCTDYAARNGAGKFFSNKIKWWLRSPGSTQNQAAVASDSDKIESIQVNEANIGVCPAIWVEYDPDVWAEFPYERLSEACTLLEEEKYMEASAILDTLDVFASAKEISADCRLIYAEDALENGDLIAAHDRLEAYAAYIDKNALEPIEDYDKDMAVYYYQTAVKFQESGKLDNAKEAWNTYYNLIDEKKMKPEKDAKQNTFALYQSIASDAESSGNYELALNLWVEAMQYATDNKLTADEDIYEKIKSCHYNSAIQKMNTGEYAEAAVIFGKLGKFEDSFSLMETCFDLGNIKYSWLTKKDAAYNTGRNNGYSKNTEIKKDDPHFGWHLGRFLISGYTSIDMEGDIPVIIKTPGKGHNLRLSFITEQDINCLNGNEKLTIADDNDGYDQKMNFPETDFGRGTLLVRFIDFRNNDSEPQPYTNCLAANDAALANTSIDINEEGTYTVALDYEIEDSDIKHITNRYNDYRIEITFKVKNGSGIFFLFDCATGSELQDYGVAPEGFRLDFANSHSLTAQITRSDINQGGTGLDVREQKSVSDGEEFVKPGCYEIKVTNKETGETLLKHLFVGDADSLEYFQSVSPELSNYSSGY